MADTSMPDITPAKAPFAEGLPTQLPPMFRPCSDLTVDCFSGSRKFLHWTTFRQNFDRLSDAGWAHLNIRDQKRTDVKKV